MAKLQFHATVQRRGPAAAIVLTDEQVRALAAVKNPPVTVTVDGVTVRVRQVPLTKTLRFLTPESRFARTS